jgi:hypothetical protein
MNTKNASNQNDKNQNKSGDIGSGEPFLAYLVVPSFIYGTLGGSVDHNATNEQYFKIPENLKFHHVDKEMYDVDPVGDPGNAGVVNFVTNYEIKYVGLNEVYATLTTHGPRFNFHPGIWVTYA